MLVLGPASVEHQPQLCIHSSLLVCYVKVGGVVCVVWGRGCMNISDVCGGEGCMNISDVCVGEEGV